MSNYLKPQYPGFQQISSVLPRAAAALSLLLMTTCTSTAPLCEDDQPASVIAGRYGPPRLMRDAGFSQQGMDRLVANLPALPFNAAKLTRAQCEAWLERTLPMLAWRGGERDFAVTHNRVRIRDGIFRQYRIFDSGPAYPARTYQLRELPLSALVPEGMGPLERPLPMVKPVDQHWYFTVRPNARSQWKRQWEVWDETTRGVGGRGEFLAEDVIFRFRDEASAVQARAVFIRLAELVQLNS